MENQKVDSRKYLSVVYTDANGVIVPHLSKCPANPDQVMAELQFLAQGCSFKVSIEDNPIDFFEVTKEINL